MDIAAMGKPKPTRPSAPYDLVIVEWEDSQQPVSSWQCVDGYTLPTITRCLSVGYLIAETPDAIALAPNLGDVMEKRIQASGVIRIPASAVRSMDRIDVVSD